MIYIDPPYNTGNDFVYNDDFAQEAGEYIHNSGQYDQEGNRLVANTESNGRFHTDWLNMIYPRLKVAKDLLSEDGVIFISIDDNEVENLKKVCNEIFGENCCITTIHCQMSTTQGMKVKAAQSGNIVKNGEYILVYSKDGHKDVASETPLYDLRPEYDEHYSLYLKSDGSIGQLLELYDYRFPKDCSNKKPMRLSEAFKKSEEFADVVRSHLADIVCSDKVTGFGLDDGLKKGFWKEVIRNDKKYILTLDANNNIRQLLRLKDSWGKCDDYYGSEGLRKIRGDWWANFYIDMGNVSKEGDVDFKNGKKPVRLVKQIAKMTCAQNDTILDFFSGSATTAHAVMQLNAEDGGKRKFIMVQLPEETDEKSEARKAGYKNICEIGKERIRRAGKKILEQLGMRNEERGIKAGAGNSSFLTPISSLDIGFRVLKLDSSNMKDVFYTPSKVTQTNLFDSAENIKEDRLENDGEDLLFQVMIELGISLSAKIKKETIAGKAVWNVDDGYLLACFAKDLDEGVITDIAKQKPYYFVMRDAGLANDNVADNFDQLFKYYSPDTIRRIL